MPHSDIAEESNNSVLKADRVDSIIIPEVVEYGIVGKAGSTIEEEERVEFVCVFDVPAEGLKHISQLHTHTPSQRR